MDPPVKALVSWVLVLVLVLTLVLVTRRNGCRGRQTVESWERWNWRER